MIPQLYDCFQHWAENGTVWIISDTHFGDEDLRRGITDRPSDDELVKLINSKVGKHDTLIHLGDVGDTSYVSKLKGYKVLITGNHDSGASNYKRIITEDKTQTRIGQDNISKRFFVYNPTTIDNHLFDEIYEGPVIIGPKLILSHEPIMNLPIMFNIHGHIHIATHNIPRHLNACLDFTDYQPIHFNSLMKSGIFKNIDDIHRVTIDKATERVKHQTAIFKKNTVNKNN